MSIKICYSCQSNVFRWKIIVCNFALVFDKISDFCFVSSIVEAQQYHVYTLQPLANPLNRHSLTASSILSQQQQEYIHQQQELKGMQRVWCNFKTK